MVKGLFSRMLAQNSKLESQISILEARNNEIHVQNEGLHDQVASLRATVDSLEQGLKAAPSTSQAHGSTANEARALFQHNNYSVPGARGDKEQGNGIPCNRHIYRPNPIVICGKSLMEIPSPTRSLNTDTVKQPQRTSLLKPAPQFMAIKRNGSTICLNALMSQKTKHRPLLALLRSFGIPWYSYNSIPSPTSRPSEPSNKPKTSVQQGTSRSSNLHNYLAVPVNQQYNHGDGQVTCHVGNKTRQIVTGSGSQLIQKQENSRDNAPLAKESSYRSIEDLPIRSNVN